MGFFEFCDLFSGVATYSVYIGYTPYIFGESTV